MGLQTQLVNASTSSEINAAFATFVRARPDALLVGADPFFTSRRAQLVQLAAHHSVIAIYSGRQFPEIGGLMSYGASLTNAIRQIGVCAGRILKGAKPADLPVDVLNGIPLGRLGTKQDVADLVLFLASPRATYLTGCVIPVDGGWSANGAGGFASALKYSKEAS